MWAFCKAVLAGAGLSVRLCWRKLAESSTNICGYFGVRKWAYVGKADLAGVGRNSGLSVRQCLRSCDEASSNSCACSVSLSLSGLGFL